MDTIQEAGSVLCNRLAELRRQSGMTQGQLAEKLGLSFQAVSKWENGQSCPDISLLPVLADIYTVSIDELFGREPLTSKGREAVESEAAAQPPTQLPWPDDGHIRAVLFDGTHLIKGGPLEGMPRLAFHYDGPAKDVISYLDLVCGDVAGNASASGSLNAGDIQGVARTGGNANTGDIRCGVNVGGSLDCGDIGGSVSAGGEVNSGDIYGGVTAKGNVNCGDVSDHITCMGNLNCGDVRGDVTVSQGAVVNCGDIDGHLLRQP